MDDKFQELLAQNVNELSAWVKTAASQSGDFVAQQAPLFIQEYLSWEFWHNAISGLLAVIAWGLILFFAYRIKKAGWEINPRDPAPSPRAVALIIAILGSMVFFPIICSYIQHCVKVKIAPRVVLVEKIADLVGVENRR